MRAATEPAATATARQRRRARATIAMLIAILLVALVGGLLGGQSLNDVLAGPWMLVVLTVPATAILLVSLRPEERYAWLVMAFALGLSTSIALYAVARSLDGRALAWTTTMADAVNTAVMVVGISLLLVLFPDGRLPSSRWRPLVPAAAAMAGLGAFAALTVGGWGGDARQAVVPSPLSGSLGDVGMRASALFFPCLMLLLVVSTASLFARYRRATGIERRQLQWLALAGATTLVIIGVNVITTGAMSAASSGQQAWLLSFGFALVPIAICIAVLRYRLYEVDIVITRSLTIGGLALFILVVYVGVVVVAGAWVGASDRSNLWLQIAATGLVAAGFQPWRRRLRHWADRVVYGDRASPYEVLGAFAGIAAQAPDDDTRQRIAQLLASGTGADPAVVWLRVGNRVRAVARHPDGPMPEPVALVDGALPQLPGDLVVAVHSDDGDHGALTITKPTGEPVSSQDRDVTGRLATGVAMTMRTQALTAELAERVAEVRASRARIVSAQDEVRRRLERNLHDGAQQQLVAMKVRLGLARTLATRQDAPRTAALLGDLAGDADAAVEDLRELARGIYPPLLESDGLAAALRALANKSQVPVEVAIEGVGRHPREIEAAAYFCVVEALTNTARHARASAASVSVTQDDNHLTIEVHDDGVGFDATTTRDGTGLAGMRDRLDVVGGSLVVESERGTGTRIVGRLPLDPADATGPVPRRNLETIEVSA